MLEIGMMLVITNIEVYILNQYKKHFSNIGIKHYIRQIKFIFILFEGTIQKLNMRLNAYVNNICVIIRLSTQ